MTAPQSGTQADGHHIYLPGRTSDGIKREFLSWDSYTPNVATTGQARSVTDPQGRVRTVAAEEGAGSINIVAKWQPDTNPDHAYLLGDTSVQLEFVQDERTIETPGAAARVAIATDGEVTFSGSGNAAAGGVGNAIKVGNIYYPIVAVYASTITQGNAGVSPFTQGEIASNLSDNKVWVLGGLSSAVTASAYSIVRPLTTTGSMAGTVVAPDLAGVPNDRTADRTATIVFTPTAGLVRQQPPTANRPNYS